MRTTGTYDAVVVGGGPAGSTAAHRLAGAGHSVLLLDRAGRIKPCGGAVPPRLIGDFAIPDHLLVARVTSARMVSPSNRQVDMPIHDAFVGMVDREDFDEWLRERARLRGAERKRGTFRGLTRDGDGVGVIHYEADADGGRMSTVRARTVIGADGAVSAVARAAMPEVQRPPFVFAYHEIIRSPEPGMAAFDAHRCDVYYRGELSPDFYAWIFPHGPTTSVGVGSAHKGFSLRGAVAALRRSAGLDGAGIVRREGAPIPLRPLRRWDNGRDVILAGDAAGVVAPASGEGIYYAMETGRLAAEAVSARLTSGDPRRLAGARREFMREHGRVFWILGMMQLFWYRNDIRRERFVSICRDPDVQRLTWQAYTQKRLVRASPAAHARIFFKDLAHLLGVVRP